MNKLQGLRVAVLATHDFEETELTEPVRALKKAGAKVEIIAPEGDTLQAVKHDVKTIKVHVDRALNEVSPNEYDALVLPGGALNADSLRANQSAKEFAHAILGSGKPVAAICHAPWLLISADLIQGRRLTSYHTIQDDVRNAGAQWVDQEVVIDGNLLTSRQPSDIPAFNREMIRLFSESRQGKSAA